VKISLYKLFSPELYLVVLLVFYGLAFIEIPIGWWADAKVDARYIDVYITFIIAFLLGVYAVRYLLRGLRPKKVSDGTEDSGLGRVEQGRLFAVYVLAIFFTMANAVKRGNFALFASDKLLFRGLTETLGGYVLYPSNLITPLSVLALYQYTKDKRLSWLLFYLTSVGLQILQLNRQEVMLCILVPLMAIYFFRRVSGPKLLQGLVAGTVIVYVFLGVLGIVRVGSATQISSSIPVYELPFWLTIADVTGAVRFAHYITDMVGAGGLHGAYTWGMFISVFIPHYNHHGAVFIQEMFTNDLTAQSIGAPLSYFADNGMTMVAALGLVQGAFAQYLLVKARQTRSLLFCAAYAMNFLDLLWGIRGGGVTFMPESLYRIAALAFILAPTLKSDNVSNSVFRSAAYLFLTTLVVSLAAFVIRIF
jgi:hypothetical protein